MIKRPDSPSRSVSLPNNLPTTSTISTILNQLPLPSPPLSNSGSSTPNTQVNKLRRANSTSSTSNTKTFPTLTSDTPNPTLLTYNLDITPAERVFPQSLAGNQSNGRPLVHDTILPDNSIEGGGGFKKKEKEFRDFHIKFGSGLLDGDEPMPGFSHDILEDDGSIVILGRDWVMPRCEAEPIRSPGAVQSFGVLFALEVDEFDNLIVGQVSENSTILLGLPPSIIFKVACLTELFPIDGVDAIRDALDALNDGDSEECLPPGFDLIGHGVIGTGHLLDSAGEEVIGGKGKGRLQWTAFASVRKLDNSPTIILEIEPHRSFAELEGARYLSSDRTLPVLGSNGGSVFIGPNGEIEVDQDIAESTTSLAKPLKELVRMRARRKRIIEREERDYLRRIEEEIERRAELEKEMRTEVDEGDTMFDLIEDDEGSVSSSSTTVPTTDTTNFESELISSLEPISTEESDSTTIISEPLELSPESSPEISPEPSEILEKTFLNESSERSKTRYPSKSDYLDVPSFPPSTTSTRPSPVSSNSSYSSCSTTSSSSSANEYSGIKVERKMESKSGNGEPDVVQLLTQCEAELRRTTDLIPFLKIAATLFKDITEFDRAMIYRFDEDWNGEILAEQIDFSRTQTRYRGLHFPETDIPVQARELYAVSPLRLLADREAEVARMCCRNLEEVNKPLNMSHCVLRALSPMCHKFLKNMGIRSTMSISIMVEEKLWGLVILQHHGDRSHRVSFPTQHICRLLGESVGRHIARLNMAAMVASRNWANLAPQIDSETGIMGSAEDILSLFRAQFGVLSLNSEAKTIGKVQDSRELMAVVEYLRRKRYATTQSTRDITTDFTDINYPAGFDLISGFISMPLSREGKDFIVFFRARHTTDITWAGNPVKPRSGVNALDPRETFEPYAATTSAKCASWADELGGIPQALIVIFGRYIDIWRRKESLLSARRLAHSLLIDASAAVRGPLNGIIQGLEDAITSAMDEETRQHILSSHTASLTLTHVINELLDLTKTEQGQALHSTEPFNVGKTIAQSLVVYSAEAAVRGIEVSILEPALSNLTLLGDAPKLQRIVTNIMSNAVRHTQGGRITIKWRLCTPSRPETPSLVGENTWIEIIIEDTGSGIPPEKLDGMFRFFEHVSGLAEYDDSDSETIASKTPAVGLGLAQVARIVQTLHGTMSVASNVGEGSKFTFRLPFQRIISHPLLEDIVMN